MEEYSSQRICFMLIFHLSERPERCRMEASQIEYAWERRLSTNMIGKHNIWPTNNIEIIIMAFYLQGKMGKKQIYLVSELNRKRAAILINISHGNSIFYRLFEYGSSFSSHAYPWWAFRWRWVHRKECNMQYHHPSQPTNPSKNVNQLFSLFWYT